jgi:hypothetical protein
MPYERALSLVMETRLSRRQSKQPAKREAKAQTKHSNGMSKKISGVSADEAAKLLEALEALLK